jgi:pimeloyl-ACP methyl ester carboxylesterase
MGAGEGEPLLLIHAGVADTRMWAGQFAAFAEHYRVIRFDMRGFGRSEMLPGSFSNVDDVKGLLDFLGVEQCYLLGISFGGLVALDFTLTFPAYVKALVLGAPSVSGDSPSQRVRDIWAQEEAAEAAGDLATATQLNVDFWVVGPHREAAEVDPAVRQLVYEMQMDIFEKVIPEDVEEIEGEAANGRLGEVSVPVLVLVGELDLEEKVALAERMAVEVPDCRLVVMEGVAHMLNMERPDLFNEYVLDFLSEE